VAEIMVLGQDVGYEIWNYFLFVYFAGVKTSFTITTAIYWSVVPALDDRC
jgi:hypothetical protein